MKTTTSYFSILAFAAAFCAVQSVSSLPLQFTLAGEGATTLADLFASSTNGHKSFVIPDTPHFRHFYDFTGPRAYSGLYTTQAGKITLGGFLRFIDESPTFFNNSIEQMRYKQALTTAISAHKNYKARTTQKNKEVLLAAQDQVLDLLSQIKLSRSVCTKLEVMLSKEASKEWAIIHSLLFPWRASLHHNPVTDELTIDQGSVFMAPIKGIGRTLTHGLITLAFIAAVDTALLWSVPAWCLAHPIGLLKADLVAGKAIMFGSSIFTTIGSFTTYKLAPEPLDGVRVLVTKHSDPLREPFKLQTPPAVDEQPKALWQRHSSSSKEHSPHH